MNTHKLETGSGCARVPEWGQRVAAIPGEWFAALTDSPRRYKVDELPFSAAERHHLQECTACRKEAYKRLQQRAQQRWRQCPSIDGIAQWLEAEENNPPVEAHVASCGLCRETVKRQAWLWEGAGLLTAEQVDAKLAAVGMGEATVAQAWKVVAALAWQQRQIALATAWAAWLAAMLCRDRGLRPAWRTAGGPTEEIGVSLEDFNAYVDADESVVLVGEKQWLLLRVEGDVVRLQAGRSPTERFEQFRVEFRRGEEVVVEVRAQDKVAELTAEHFQTAQQKQADRLVIIA